MSNVERGIDPSKVTKRDVFLRAAEVVEERGWQRYHWGDVDEGPVCLLGAIGVATIEMGVAPLYATTASMASMSFRFERPDLWDDANDPWLWNDGLRFAIRPSRRPKARVVAALRRLADGATWKEATA